MKDRIGQLEYTIMELGTEIYRLKSEMQQMSNIQSKSLKTLKGLQNMLDERGVIAMEDFDIETDLQQLLDKLDKLNEMEYENSKPLKRSFN
jgi:hypothetical protein